MRLQKLRLTIGLCVAFASVQVVLSSLTTVSFDNLVDRSNNEIIGAVSSTPTSTTSVHNIASDQQNSPLPSVKPTIAIPAQPSGTPPSRNVSADLPYEQRFLVKEFTKMIDSHSFPTYNIHVSPLPEFNCEAYRDTPECNGHSYFQVVAIGGHAVVPSVMARCPTETGALYCASLQVPFSGNYTIRVLLSEFNYTRIYRDFRSRDEWNDISKEYTDGVIFPLRYGYLRPIVGGDFVAALEGTLEDYSARSTLPLCSDLQPPTLPGFWDPGHSQYFSEYFPNSCRLRRLNPSSTKEALQTSTEATSILEVVNGTWLRFFGDSNTRHLFDELCKATKGLASTPRDRGDLQLCVTPRNALTYVSYWPGHPPLQTLLNASFQDVLSIMEGVSPLQRQMVETLPCFNATYPNATLISFGSHTFYALKSEIAREAAVLDGYFQSISPVQSEPMHDEAGALIARPPTEQQGVYLILQTTATDPSFLDSVQSLHQGNRFHQLQNNWRIRARNDAALKYFAKCCSFADLFSPTEIFHPSGDRTPDALHFYQKAYLANTEIMLNILHGAILRRPKESQSV